MVRPGDDQLTVFETGGDDGMTQQFGGIGDPLAGDRVDPCPIQFSRSHVPLKTPAMPSGHRQLDGGSGRASSAWEMGEGP